MTVVLWLTLLSSPGFALCFPDRFLFTFLDSKSKVFVGKEVWNPDVWVSFCLSCSSMDYSPDTVCAY